jgi:hypothetical protein
MISFLFEKFDLLKAPGKEGWGGTEQPPRGKKLSKRETLNLI